jgi:transposase-like protein
MRRGQIAHESDRIGRALLMSERGVTVDHTTLFRWVQHYAPLMEKRIRWYQRYTDASWRVDETYVKVAGRWGSLYRAIDKNGETIDFMLSPCRTAKSARRFLGKALKLREECPPETINTDQNEAYGKAIALKRAGELEKRVQHRQVKYLNNRLEADHGALKRLINPTRGFKTLPTASATIKGFEVMRMIRKRQCLMLESGVAREVRFVNRLFRLAA